MRIAALALLVGTALGPLAATADAAPLRTLHVATTGNDGGDGSSAQPWRTLQRAANAARAGDLIVVAPGGYAGFDLRTSGTSANPIVFQAQPGVLINAPNPVRPSEGINLEGASWVVVEGFTVNGMPRAGIRSVTNHHVTIRGNTTDGNGRWGIFSGFSDDLTVEDNVTSRSAAEHGIYVSNSGDRPIIRRNHVWGNNACGIHMNGDASMGGDGLISGALVEGNLVHGNGRGGGSGINADGVQDSRFLNNIVVDNHASGISLYRIDGAAGSRNNLVAHNTIVQAADGRWALNIRDGSTGTRILNNILLTLHTWRGAISVTADSRTGLTSDANAVTPRFTLNDGASTVDLAGWRQATGQDQHSFATTPAAVFVDPADGDYHVLAGAPVVDAGVTVAGVTTDFEGHARPAGLAPDVGADESGTPGDPPPTDPPPTDPPPASGPADLVVTALSAPPATVTRGTTFTVTDTVANAGGTAARSSTTRYFLSRDPVRSSADRLLADGRTVPALDGGASSTSAVTLKVPKATPTGTWFLVACADYRKVVKEAAEQNNCRTAAASFEVLR